MFSNGARGSRFRASFSIEVSCVSTMASTAERGGLSNRGPGPQEYMGMNALFRIYRVCLGLPNPDACPTDCNIKAGSVLMTPGKGNPIKTRAHFPI